VSAASVSSCRRQLTTSLMSCHYVCSAHHPHCRDIRWNLAITIQIQMLLTSDARYSNEFGHFPCAHTNEIIKVIYR